MKMQIRFGILTLGVCILAFAVLGCKAAVETKAWFPDNPGNEFTAGKPASAIVGVRNDGAAAFNISATMGSLALVSNPSGSIYNFTGMSHMLPEVEVGDEAMVEYTMYMPNNMPPRDFILRLQLFTFQNGQYSSIVVFNETISVLEPNKLVDTELLGLYAMLMAAIGAAGYFLFSFAQKKGWVKKARRSKAFASAGTNDKSEWLKGTVADKSKKK